MFIYILMLKQHVYSVVINEGVQCHVSVFLDFQDKVFKNDVCVSVEMAQIKHTSFAFAGLLRPDALKGSVNFKMFKNVLFNCYICDHVTKEVSS